MTTSEKKALQRDLKDPVHFFTLLAENNPEGLSNQFQSWGITYGSSDQQQMVAELMKMWNSGNEGKRKALKLVSGVQYKFGIFPAEFDMAITGQTPPPAFRTTDGQGEETNWYSDIDWGGIIDSVFTGVGNLTGSDQPSGGPSTPPAGGSGSGEEKAAFNMQWIAVGAAALILIVALFIALRK
jgi:hypothetical protein